MDFALIFTDMTQLHWASTIPPPGRSREEDAASSSSSETSEESIETLASTEGPVSTEEPADNDITNEKHVDDSSDSANIEELSKDKPDEEVERERKLGPYEEAANLMGWCF